MKENNNKYLGNELEYIKKVLESEKWSSTEGSWTNKLEKEFASIYGAKYAIAANSGTATLHMALEALGVQPGDEVITPALTVIMDTSCIIHANAIPIYADVDYSLNIAPKEVRKKITNKTKAIIAVSLYGKPCDIEELMKIAKEYNIFVIEDNAQHMGRHRAHITSYSFENTKHLSCGEGGIVLTDNEEWARKMRLLGNHGFKNSEAEEGRTKLNLDIFQDPNYKRHSLIGWNYRMSEFSAAIALAQLERSKELINFRSEVAKMFIEVFNKQKSKQFPFEVGQFDIKHSYWTFSVLFHVTSWDWHLFRKKYIENGGDGFYGCWQVPYLEPVMEKGFFKNRNLLIYKDIEYKKGLCPNAEKLQSQIIQFKTNYRDMDLAKQKVEALEKTLKDFGYI
jgi:perosamine synthetase